jgi:phosphoribosylanthranilate isomerase
MRLPVRVKICGITTLDDALAAVEAGASALGFNFYPGSPRYVSPAAVREIVAHLPRQLCVVGVFVDAPRRDVARIAAEAGLTALQFHGNEEAAACRGWTQKVIKAIRVRDAAAAALALQYDVDFILADAYLEGHLGGTGARIQPELLAGFDRGHLILAGGLTPENVGAAVRAIRPFGLDVASGVEAAPGKKHHEKMRRFIANAQSA